MFIHSCKRDLSIFGSDVTTDWLDILQIFNTQF